MFDVSSRAKLSVSALAERKIASARPRKYGLLLRAEEEMLLYGQALASITRTFPNRERMIGDRAAALRKSRSGNKKPNSRDVQIFHRT